jgi:type II secretory pathway pseudopilin PulG
MTLIELLVVIVILTTIVAAAIPLLSPTNDDRRLRETARAVNTFFNGAQSRAIARKRPVGVALKRLSKDTNRGGDHPTDRGVCVEMFYVEQPAPYTGFDANSRASVALHPQIPGFVLVRFISRGGTSNGLPTGWSIDPFPSRLVAVGDLIEINGTQYELIYDPSFPLQNIQLDLTLLSQDPTLTYFETANANQPAQIVARPRNDSGQQVNPRYDNLGNEIGSVVAANPPYWSNPSAYKVLRRPTPTADEPYQLPEGTAIDLRASGVGSNNFFYRQDQTANDEGMVVMFGPEGRVVRVGFYPTTNTALPFDGPVVDNIYLLVGRRDKAPPPAVGSDSTLNIAEITAAVTDDQRNRLREPINWLSGTSRWVVIGPQSGRIATIENGFVELPTIATLAMPGEDKRNQQILAAREFTREMGQLGGR